jgi:DNA-binding XRE family transcriptional regulator
VFNWASLVHRSQGESGNRSSIHALSNQCSIRPTLTRAQSIKTTLMPYDSAAVTPEGTTPSLRYWRTQLAVPQQDLADFAQVGRSTVTRLEAGGSARLSTVRRLAAVLEVSPAKLMAQPPEA